MQGFCEQCRWWHEDRPWSDYEGQRGHCTLITAAVNGRKIAKITHALAEARLDTPPDFSCSHHQAKS